MIRSLILRTATRLIVPVMLLFSLHLLLEGHHSPGGGFSGGLVAAGAFALYAIAYGDERAQRTLPLRPIKLIPIGLGMALLSAIAPLFRGDPLLTGMWTSLPLGNGNTLDLGTPLLFDGGVYLIVIGTVLTLVFTLEEICTRLFSGTT